MAAIDVGGLIDGAANIATGGAWSTLGKIAGVALPVLGDFLGGQQQAEFNAAEAKKQREWQTEMSNTQYQRAAKDLEAAGLNRILALGSPAPTPSGAVASMSQPSYGKTGIAAASAIQSIQQSKAEESLIKQREAESKATENLAISNSVTSMTQAELNRANAKAAEARARLDSANATRNEVLNPVQEPAKELLEYLSGKLKSGARAAVNLDEYFRQLLGIDINNALDFANSPDLKVRGKRND